MRRGETVILAAGDFPRRGTEARRLLEGARRVVCCDGAADAYRRRLGRLPDVVIGDLDSVVGKYPCVVCIEEQETNDLEKAIAYCKQKGWKRPVILGATGKREDHAIGNVFRAFEHGLEVVTDHGKFVTVEGKSSFRVDIGTEVSIFAVNPRTHVVSKGLEWPLDGVKFRNLYCATLNRAASVRISLESNLPICVYIESQKR